LAFAERAASKQEVYQSCELLAPNDELLAKCDRRKIKWYLNKGLAELLEERFFRFFFFFLSFFFFFLEDSLLDSLLDDFFSLL